ncbi:hypothetical protein [Streptomyces sp. NPDC001635]
MATRARKTAATQADADTATPTPKETTTAAADGSASQQDATPAAAAADNPATPDAPAPARDEPAAPDAAPLEPPAIQEPPAAPETEPGYVTPTEVIPDDENLADVILDDATKQPPADVDAVFRPLTPYGSTLVCTVRLIEQTFLGPHQSPVTRLLQPAGAHVSESVAARIRERLEAQAARNTAQADATTEQ